MPRVWPASVTTVAEARGLLRQLGDLRVWQKGQARGARFGAVTRAPQPELDPELAKMLGAQAGLAETDALIDKLEDALTSARIVHLTLPTLPDEQVKADLANWFRNNIAPDVLLEFSADAELSGGLVVRTRNHIYNFSLRRTLWEARSKIPEILRRG